MKKLFTSLAAVFAAIPGLSTIVVGLGAPPDYKVLFGGVIESLGVLALLIVALNRAKLQRWSIKRVTKVAITFGVVFVLCLSVYSHLFNQCVFVSPLKHDKVFFPIWIHGRLAEEVQARGGSRERTLKELEDWVRLQLDTDRSRSDESASAIILLLLYCCTTTSLVIAFALPGFHLKHPERLLEPPKEMGDKKTQKKGN